MNDSDFDYTPTHQSMSAFLPLMLLGVSLTLYLIFQISSIWNQQTALLTARITTEAPSLQARQKQAGLERLVMDVLQASATDSDARDLVTKYGIRMDQSVAAQKK